ncbi:hypothetical protein B0A50_07917 [Salinomyces thailandicus]|uniref:RED-like N-terminal domain-containing protein n=1 Tax=Salinomyces thailandicus TaxID=706561 RepID=A0A4U0TKJ6_9PEZI|nr:hypothetical protein B0A50_07917 [Salinomyces thailandica]
MNNSQFRNLLFKESKSSQHSQPDASPQNGAKASATLSAFGAKRSSFMPMTPRNVKGGIDVDFARQVRERNAALGQQVPTGKKHKTRAPRGVKLGAGYIDRAKARAEAGDEEVEGSKAARIKALEEQMKLGQIPRETFEALRDEIAGGDVDSTHLYKGLDRRLLERVRRGEDVLGIVGGDGKTEPAPDVDEELDRLEEKEVRTVAREKSEKKGNMAAPAQLAGKKRSRDEIMAELKAQRQAAAAAKAEPALDGRWRRVGDKQKNRVEIDAKGREVLITVDEDGVVKKRVRKAPAQSMEAVEMPDSSKPVLGADAEMPAAMPAQMAEAASEKVEDEDDDIFEGVGTDYDPLGNVDDDEDDEDDESDEGGQKQAAEQVGMSESRARSSGESRSPKQEPTEPLPPAPSKRNYFGDTSLTEAEQAETDRFAGVQNLLKKAAKQGVDGEEDVDSEDDEEARAAKQAHLKKRAAMLAQQDRDMEDMDMGFGSSRYEDEADVDGEGKKVRLSEWKAKSGADGEDGGWEEGGGKEKKKRKPKKRKGDVNNAADIMKVIEGRKAGGSASGK